MHRSWRNTPTTIRLHWEPASDGDTFLRIDSSTRRERNREIRGTYLISLGDQLCIWEGLGVVYSLTYFRGILKSIEYSLCSARAIINMTMLRCVGSFWTVRMCLATLDLGCLLAACSICWSTSKWNKGKITQRTQTNKHTNNSIQGETLELTTPSKHLVAAGTLTEQINDANVSSRSLWGNFPSSLHQGKWPSGGGRWWWSVVLRLKSRRRRMCQKLVMFFFLKIGWILPSSLFRKSNI